MFLKCLPHLRGRRKLLPLYTSTVLLDRVSHVSFDHDILKPFFLSNVFYSFQVRYALSCLSYTSPSQCIQYTNCLRIVDLLIEQYSIDLTLCQALIGNNYQQIHLFPLFDFIFYSLIQQRNDLEKFAWKIFLNINLTKELGNILQSIIQNTFVYNYYFSHIILSMATFSNSKLYITFKYITLNESHSMQNLIDFIYFYI